MRVKSGSTGRAIRPRSGRGLSLPEVLVAIGIVGVLTTVLFQIMVSGRSVAQHGWTRTQLQQEARNTVNRLAPLISSALPPDDVQDCVYSPETGDEGSFDELWFYAPDDFFGNAALQPRNLSFHLYRIRHQDGVILEELTMNGTATPLGTPPRRIAPETVRVEFRRPEAGLVRIRVVAKELPKPGIPPAQQVLRESSLDTTISLPFYSSQ